MFTKGFKLFFGFALAAVVAALTYGWASGDTTGANYFGVLDREAFKGIISLGWQGSVGEPIGYVILIMFAVATAFLGLTLVAFRDADPESVAELTPTGELAPADGPTAPSIWPIAGAVGVGVFIVGLATSKVVWWLGVAILAVVVFEWMMSAWADRATGDPVVNAELRRAIMGPVEIPVISIGVIAIVAVAISRILLTVSELNAVWVASAVAVLIFALGGLFAMKPDLSKNIFAGLAGLLAVGVLAAGIVSAAVGERDIVHHEVDSEDAEHSEEETGMGVLGAVVGVLEDGMSLDQGAAE